MTDNGTDKRTILMALDPATPGYAGIELLRRLARGRGLLGLYVEDVELLAHAGSRLATEVVRTGAARPLELTALERQLRAQSLAIRRLLEAEAGRLGLAVAFRSVRGRVVSELAAAAAGAEMLIVELPRAGTGAQSIWSSRLDQLCRLADLPTAMYLREPWRPGARVLALIDTPDEIEATVSAAAALAHARDAPVTALIGEQARGYEARIAAALNEAAGTPQTRLLARADPAISALAYLVRTSNAGALVAPARLARADAAFMRELLRLTRCSIVLVNPAPRRGGPG